MASSMSRSAADTSRRSWSRRARGRRGWPGGLRARSCILDALVDAVDDEQAHERGRLQGFVDLLALDLQFLAQEIHEALGVVAQDVVDGHLDGALLLDDDGAQRGGDFALGEDVERLDGLLDVGVGGEGDFDLDLAGGVVADGLGLDLALLGGVFDGPDERFGGHAVGQLADDEGGLVLLIDDGAQADLAAAFVVSRASIRPPWGKSGTSLRAFSGGWRSGPGAVRRSCAAGRGWTGRRRCFRAEHEQQRQLGRQHDGLLVAAVVGGDELGEVGIEQLRGGEIRQAALDVARRGGGIAGVDVAEVALAFDQVAAVDQRDQRVADGGVAVRVVLHGVADDVGDLDEAAVVLFVERVENPALDGLEAVVELRNGAVADDVGGVLQKIAVHEPVQRPVAEILFVDARRRGGGGGRRLAGALGGARGVVVGSESKRDGCRMSVMASTVGHYTGRRGEDKRQGGGLDFAPRGGQYGGRRAWFKRVVHETDWGQRAFFPLVRARDWAEGRLAVGPERRRAQIRRNVRLPAGLGESADAKRKAELDETARARSAAEDRGRQIRRAGARGGESGGAYT
jgi:hypothetical protein